MIHVISAHANFVPPTNLATVTSMSLKYVTNHVCILVALILCPSCSESITPEPRTEQVPLSSLTITPAGDLLPEFSSGMTNYAATVPTDVNSVSVEATPEDASATIAINGMVTPSGAKQSVALRPLGMETPIEVVASSPTGQSTTYTVMVTRLASRDVSLAFLSVSSGSLQPAFDPGVENYKVNVNSDVTNVTLSATKADRNATLSGAVTVAAGATAGETAIALTQAGTISYASVTVTAPNGNFRIYNIAISRLLPNGDPPPIGGPPSTVSTLSGLAVSVATLSPSFSPTTTTYGGTFNTCFPGIQTLTATKSDPNATMSMPGKFVPAGVPSGAVNVYAGVTTTIVVTAQDQVQKTTYSVTVAPPFCR